GCRCPPRPRPRQPPCPLRPRSWPQGRRGQGGCRGRGLGGQRLGPEFLEEDHLLREGLRPEERTRLAVGGDVGAYLQRRWYGVIGPDCGVTRSFKGPFHGGGQG